MNENNFENEKNCEFNFKSILKMAQNVDIDIFSFRKFKCPFRKK